MKRFSKIIITKRLISKCSDCSSFGEKGYGGWFGNTDAGGFSFYCKKSHNKNICNTTYQSKENAKEAEKKAFEEISKIPAWCPLEDFK